MNKESDLTPEEVANLLKITKYTVYELVKRGQLPAYRVGNKIRIAPDDLEAYRNRNRVDKNVTPESNAGYPASFVSTPLITAESPARPEGLIICGQDVLLDILSQQLEHHPHGCQVLRQNIGSFAGLLALYQNRADMTAIHLWDSDSGTYNIPFVRRLVPGIPTLMIHLACRMQGFYVPEGNPKNLRSWEDVRRDDVIIINREAGSGTRVLLDEQLYRMGIDRRQIKGYETEVLSHLAVASTVARGAVDAGLGNQKASLQVRGIDFIPLQKERYDLVIKQEDMEKAPVQAVVEILLSSSFQSEVQGLGDYDFKDIGKITRIK